MSMPESAIMMTGPDLGRRKYMARRLEASTDNSGTRPGLPISRGYCSLIPLAFVRADLREALDRIRPNSGTY